MDTVKKPALGWDDQGKRNGTVALVAMGYSHRQYFDDVSTYGSPKAVADQTWLVNSMALSTKGDMLFMMDDLEHSLAEVNATGKPDVRAAALREWVPNADIPIMTCRAKPYMPTAIEYPLGDVISSVGSKWFNNTLPYAVAYANHIGVAKMKIYGADYYARESADAPQFNANAAWEKGMACLVHHVTLFLLAGGKVEAASTSVLLDMGLAEFGMFYGYGADQPVLEMVDGKIVHRFETNNVVPITQAAE